MNIFFLFYGKNVLYVLLFKIFASICCVPCCRYVAELGVPCWCFSNAVFVLTFLLIW